MGPARHNDDDLRVVSVRTAMRLLSMSRSTIYRRLEAGELDSIHDGRRKITIASIRQYLARRRPEANYRQARQLLGTEARP
jgi:hypothetical protein